VHFHWVSRLRVTELLVFLAASSLGHAQLTISGYNGLTASLSTTGSFQISIPNPGWQFGGNAGAAAYDSQIASGTDNLGAWQELAFDYTIGSSSRSASIRAYANRPIVMFAVTYNNASPNATSFPVFSAYPGGLSNLTYNGQFAAASFAGYSSDSPWIYFDKAANTFIVSPASDYMTAATVPGPSGQIEAGISNQIATLPAGMTHRTAFAFGQGINTTIAAWGQALTDLAGKQRPANDADALLNAVSYWTDNGATYYYNAGGSSYTDTLLAVKNEFESKGISLGSLQLDSWWYPKGPDDAWTSSGGIWAYTASAAIFQPDLAAFQTKLGVPLVTHARWIDAGSPYRGQYVISGNVATDPQYWEDIATYLKSSGVAGYEQDWLGSNAQTAFNLTDPEAFLGNMAASMARRGITMMYCMADPKHFLQGTNYSNLTTIRTSQDRFDNTRWTSFLYSSRLAGALGVWPFADVFHSSERNNLILATLSAGPVGVGDPLGGLSKANLLKSVRADGVIVKPDVPAVPDDSVLIADAQNIDTPMIATAYSDFGGLRATYIFAYSRATASAVTIKPSTYGIAGPAYLFDYLNAAGYPIDAGSARIVNLTTGVGYFVLAPVGATGVAFLGDKGHFVTLGKKRIPALTDSGQIDVTVSFAAGEHMRTLFGYSPMPVSVSATVGDASALVWDSTTQLFTVNVHASGKGVAHVLITQASTPASASDCNVSCGTGPAPRPVP
jgi:hypothetical protein